MKDNFNNNFDPKELLVSINTLIDETNWNSVKNPDTAVLAIETKAYLIYASRKCQRIVELMDKENK